MANIFDSLSNQPQARFSLSEQAFRFGNDCPDWLAEHVYAKPDYHQRWTRGAH
jgi:hypothetical protein